MTLLITPEEIFSRTPLSSNVDATKLKPYIEDMQYKYLNSLLGATLTRKIISDFESDSLVDSYAVVFGLMKSILIYATVGEYILFNQYQLTNAGVYKFTSDSGENVTSNEAEALAKRYKSKADIYISELERYLCSTLANLPEYSVQDNNFDKRPSRKGEGSGWSF